MPKLVITRGLPGSGKSTHAKGWVAEDPAHRARVNRDDLRAQLHDGVYLGADTERQIIAVRDAAITALLKRGVDVVCDETALSSRKARDLRHLAVLAGADFEVWDLTNIDVAECIRWDATRDQPVGEQVIRDKWNRYVRGRPHPLPLPDEPEPSNLVANEHGPYLPPAGAPKTIIVDVDGTVALMAARSPFDETRVHEDRPNLPVIAVVRAMYADGHAVVFCSGRTESCRTETEKWLREHVAVPFDGLLMRAAGDMRKDSIVKAELFDDHIRHDYHVVAVLDDRASVVAMWRNLGLTVLQVADGDF